jgi:HD-like signal output (HDOD) protein
MDLKNEENFLKYVRSAIENNKLVLPTLPEVALQVRQAVNAGKASDAELARLIAGDPGLSARLLQIVNSPVYRARQKIDSLQAAIARMGHNTIRTLITSLAMQQLFKPKLLMLDQYFHAVWRESVNVAAMSRVLAARCPHLNKEQAMLAGLIHQIGKLPILTLAEKFPELAREQAALESLLDKLHPAIGKMILESWDLPEQLSRAAWEYRDLKRNPGGEPDYVDLVQVAWAENELFKFNRALPNIAEIGAFQRLGLNPEIEVLEIEGVKEEIREIEVVFL